MRKILTFIVSLLLIVLSVGCSGKSLDSEIVINDHMSRTDFKKFKKINGEPHYESYAYEILQYLFQNVLYEKIDFYADLKQLSVEDRAYLMNYAQSSLPSDLINEMLDFKFATEDNFEIFIDSIIGKSNTDIVGYFEKKYADQIQDGTIKFKQVDFLPENQDIFFGNIQVSDYTDDNRYVVLGYVKEKIDDSNTIDCGDYEITFSVEEGGYFKNWKIDSISVIFYEKKGYIQYPFKDKLAFIQSNHEKREENLVDGDNADEVEELEIPISNAVASSTLNPQGNNTYFPSNIFDKNKSTAYVEGSSGNGIGESISVFFDTTSEEYKEGISLLKIRPGYQKNKDLYYKNCRPSKLECILTEEVTHKEYKTELLFSEDKPATYTFSIKNSEGKPIVAEKCTFVIKDVYSGSKYDDCCISEVEFYALEKRKADSEPFENNVSEQKTIQESRVEKMEKRQGKTGSK